MSADPAVGLGQIEAADPGFDLELFKRQAVETFLAYKEALSTRDPTDVSDRLSDRVFDDLQFEIQSLEARDAVQHFDGLAPTSVTVAAAERGPRGDTVTLQIKAVAMEYLGPADSRGPAPGAPGAFTEFWTFTRSLDSTTPASHPNECPNCGAPIDLDTGRICRYCRTLLPAPHAQTGWLVAAVRPAQETPS